MKFLAILGSPHGKRGNTAKLLDEVLAGVVEAGGEVETISLAEKRVAPCLGCDACHKRGACPIDDDFEQIREKLLACDGFVLASPNYIFSVSAQMKALMDRCCGIIHCLALEGKYGAVVETSGGGGDEEVIEYMGRFVAVWEPCRWGASAHLWRGRGFSRPASPFCQARKVGRNCISVRKEKRRFPEQDAPREAFAAEDERAGRKMKDFWPYEYEYWQKVRG